MTQTNNKQQPNKTVKKYTILFALALTSLIHSAFAQSIDEVPESIPYGKIALIEALTQIDELEYSIYTIENGEKSIIETGGTSLDSFSSTNLLAEQIQNDVEFQFDVDPRKMIHIEVNLLSHDDEILFTSNTSFYLEIDRNSDGSSEYSLPSNADNLNFLFQGVRVKIPGIYSASAKNAEKTWELDVNDNGLWLPSYLSRTNIYETLEINFYNGQTIQYDWFGLRVEEKDFDVEVDSLNFNDIMNIPINEGKVFHSRLYKNDGWSQMIEINNDLNQDIEFLFRSYDNYSVPTHIWFYTIEGYKNGEGPDVYEYSDDGYEWNSGYTQTYNLSAGNYYIILEWRGDTNINSWYSGGGKG